MSSQSTTSPGEARASLATVGLVKVHFQAGVDVETFLKGDQTYTLTWQRVPLPGCGPDKRILPRLMLGTPPFPGPAVQFGQVQLDHLHRVAKAEAGVKDVVDGYVMRCKIEDLDVGNDGSVVAADAYVWLDRGPAAQPDELPAGVTGLGWHIVLCKYDHRETYGTSPASEYKPVNMVPASPKYPGRPFVAGEVYELGGPEKTMTIPGVGEHRGGIRTSSLAKLHQAMVGIDMSGKTLRCEVTKAEETPGGYVRGMAYVWVQGA
ncbi:hypothetical protein DL769_010235 [Monosporascus sp. CRB-8-3]|nr:hypothetical protein DL769_010235 [Monosporascus sp. CRB-8-3]